MVNIDKYYNRVVERIDNTDNKYLKNFEMGAVELFDLIPLIIESKYSDEFLDNPVSLGNKTLSKFLLNRPDRYENLAYIGGVVAGTFLIGNTYLIPWFITGTLDVANYLQRKSKEYNSIHNF